MLYQFGVDVGDGEVAEIEADNLDQAKKEFKKSFPGDFDKITVITSDNGYEEIFEEKWPIKKEQKEVGFVLPVSTVEQIIKAEKLQVELYQKYNSVKVYPSGFLKIRIVAK